ncbi:phage portal protein [Tianweitania sediminis]|uniref:Phage portal protein n=1 Tax=Tianweitania sediminis TaxID=1502156 RepID=A0A8J7R129_9HYPH|nr:phage portal protein [Tianweitania sediminis]MBP0440678.1 phage portal protein [Tianweitania sediminis]
MIAEKPRVRVKAGAAALPAAQPKRSQPTARYLRQDKQGLLNMRRAITRDAKLDVFEAAERASALALDFIHNSGGLSGAVSQIVCDTIGVELKLNCRARLKSFGYTDKQADAWCREVEAAWQQWAWNPKECDLAGEMTIAEMCDAILRSYLAYGEGFGVLDHLTVRRRRQYSVRTGLKVSLVAPHRCPRTTREFEGLEGGIFRNEIRRPVVYRFRIREGGLEIDHDVSARDVVHVMDRGEHLNATRGISPMAPILKVAAQYDQLADATLAVALMQQAFAAIIKSPEASNEAFQAIESLDGLDVPEGYDAADWATLLSSVRADLVEVWSQRFDALKNGSVSLTDPARIAHLGPGEDLEMVTASAPQSNYVAFAQNLQREIARCLGVTFESYTGDHSNANYSSVRMAVASIWPVVMRRRQRIVVPFIQTIFENWLEEAIREGRVPFKGGYAAFQRDPEAVFQAEFQGPERPSADPYKDALASKILMELGLASHADEAIARGKNPQELLVQIAREIKMMQAAGIPVPFGRTQGGGGGPNGAAAEGRREPAQEAA